MKRLFQLGFVLGLAGTLALAWFAPLIEYTRYRSATSVVANGGRVEQFLVHLPADRIESPAGAEIERGTGVSIEHYKLRDAEGNVIGLAARHVLSAAGGTAETAWLLAIPSRGSISLVTSAPAGPTIEAAVAAQGVAAGETVDEPLSIDSGRPATSVASTGEFAGIDFELVDTWVVTGRDASGAIRGTLRLNTVGRRSS